MKTIKIYGASDDLIEIDGDIREEFVYLEEGETGIAISDGTLIVANYDSEGCWRFHRLVKGSAEYTKVEAEGPDSKNYSDVVTLTGENIRWVVMGAIAQ